MGFKKSYFIGILLGISVITLDLVFLREEKVFYFLIVVGGILVFLPFIISVVGGQSRHKKVEEKFLEFIRDLVEHVKSGTPISKSVVNLKDRDYGELTKYVQKLANQISSGIPLSRAMEIFAKETGSKVIARAVNMISEAEKAGGDISEILESVSKSINQIEILKKERKSAVYNIIVQGYIIFLIFIIIMLVLQFVILPLAGDLANTGDLAPSTGGGVQAESPMPMLMLIITQSFFTGLVIGKIAEGSFKDGVKHSFILVSLTLLITTIANIFLG